MDFSKGHQNVLAVRRYSVIPNRGGSVPLNDVSLHGMENNSFRAAVKQYSAPPVVTQFISRCFQITFPEWFHRIWYISQFCLSLGEAVVYVQRWARWRGHYLALRKSKTVRSGRSGMEPVRMEGRSHVAASIHDALGASDDVRGSERIEMHQKRTFHIEEDTYRNFRFLLLYHLDIDVGALIHGDIATNRNPRRPVD